MAKLRIQWTIPELKEFQRLWNEDRVPIAEIPVLLNKQVSAQHLRDTAHRLRQAGFYFKTARRIGNKQFNDVVDLARLANLQRYE
jgi:hypothetical protein